MSDRFRIAIDRPDLGFCAGHFVTFPDGSCERIHGHNWRVALELESPLDASGFVVDFVQLQQDAREVLVALEHRMILPDRSPHLQITDNGCQVTCRYRDRFWSLPSDECLILPIANTTTEWIAGWIADRLVERLAERRAATPFDAGSRLLVKLEEATGCWAILERPLDAGARAS